MSFLHQHPQKFSTEGVSFSTPSLCTENDSFAVLEELFSLDSSESEESSGTDEQLSLSCPFFGTLFKTSKRKRECVHFPGVKGPLAA